MTVVDITHLLDKEDGSAFDTDSVLFSAFDDGDVFMYDASNVRAMDDMLERDGKANTLEQVLTLPIRQAPHSIQRGKAKTKVADFIADHFGNPANNGGMTTPMNLIISQSLGAIVHRKAYFEKVFTERDGRIVYDKVAWRPPATCKVYRDKKTGAFKGFKQQPIRYEDTDEITIPAQRAFVYIHGTHRNPLEGTSALEIAHWCYLTKQKIRFLWYSFLEGQSLPKTIVKAGDQPTANKIAKKIIALRQGGVVGIDKRDADIEAFESSGKGAAQFKEALQWLDAEASGSVLAGFTDLGASAASGTGSFALSKDQTDFFLMSRQATARELSDHFNQFLIPDLVRYNFGPNEPSPEFEFGPIAEDDANMAITLLQATAQNTSPVLPREFYEELIERVAGFLELDTNKVREGLDRVKKEAEEKAEQEGTNPAVAGVAAVVDKATGAVINKQIGAVEDGDAKVTPPGPRQPNGIPVSR